MNQREIRQGVKVGPGLTDITPVASWYKAGHFNNDDQAQGAFELSYQQGLDGMGRSIEEWMGLTKKQFAAWMSNRSLPRKR